MGRFTRKGVSKINFTTSLASQTSPSIAALNSGTVLHTQVNEISGFQFQNNPISVPDLAALFVPQIAGEDTADNSSFTFYDDDTVTTIRTALVKGATGFVTLSPYGLTVSKRAEVWPVVSTGCNDQWTTANEAAKFGVQFGITSAPNQNATLAA